MNKGMDTSDEKAYRIAYLIAGYIRQTLSPEEHDELDRWVEESDENMLLFEELTDEKNIEAGLAEMKEGESYAAYKRIKKKIPFQKKKKTRVFRAFAVAASIILVVIAAYFFIPVKNKTQQTPPIATIKNDLPPGSDKAVLTLGDGRKIILEDQRNGRFVSEQDLQVVKLDSGHIAYNSTYLNQPKEWNTLTTPKGGQYQVTLSDGTRVWLNAATSLRYPVAFDKGERRVELDGEAYFEVAHDASRPFHVVSKNQDIKVLGTKFNVNAYSDEEVVTTSLLEGMVELSSHGQTRVVRPGEQFYTGASGSIQKSPKPDMEEATAWKEGFFHFRNATVEEILKQVSRWYDAEIIYEGKVEKHFNADISRKLPVSQLLNLLEKTGEVHFKIEGKKIKVRP